MKRSEVMKNLIDSYILQHGNKTDRRVLEKARKIKNKFDKEEKA